MNPFERYDERSWAMSACGYVKGSSDGFIKGLSHNRCAQQLIIEMLPLYAKMHHKTMIFVTMSLFGAYFAMLKDSFWRLNFDMCGLI